MNNQTNIDWLIEVATKYGYTEEQIVLICDEIGRASYEQFAQEVERLFSAEEKQKIEEIAGDEAVSAEMMRLYQEKTGQDAQNVINGYISRHITDFIEDHSQGPQSPSA